MSYVVTVAACDASLTLPLAAVVLVEDDLTPPIDDVVITATARPVLPRILHHVVLDAPAQPHECFAEVLTQNAVEEQVHRKVHVVQQLKRLQGDSSALTLC